MTMCFKHAHVWRVKESNIYQSNTERELRVNTFCHFHEFVMDIIETLLRCC